MSERYTKNPTIRVKKVSKGFLLFFGSDFLEVDSAVAELWSEIPFAFDEAVLLQSGILHSHENQQIYARLKQANYLLAD